MQNDILLEVIRGYEFAFNATQNIGYLNVYLELVKLYNERLEYNNNVLTLKVA